MKEYFHLQSKMLHRKVVDLGLPIGLIYPILLVLFIGASAYLFSAIGFASYIYAAIALSAISALSEPRRNTFLRTVFSLKRYKVLRIVENLIFATPFVLFLCVNGSFLMALVLYALAIVLALFRFKVGGSRAMPTPFGKHPFEFMVGFRKLFFVVPILYVFTGIAAREANFGIAVVSLLLLTFVCLSFYAKPEANFYVWAHNSTPKQFLLAKIKRGCIQFSVLAIPMVVCTGIFFVDDLVILLCFYVLCLAYLAAFVLGKYAAFPRELSVPQGLLLAISVAFPPLLVAVIPFFYKRSIENLKPLLV